MSNELATTGGEAGSVLTIIASAARDPSVDVAKLEALLRMQERVLARQAEAEFNVALAAVSAAVPRVKKNGTVDMGAKGSYPFATWPDVDAAIRPLMIEHGLSLSFDMTAKTDGGGAIISGTLLHSGGHSRTITIPLALDAGAGRNNLQAMGSTLSYGKRYLAEMFFNVVREGVDDDGVSGGKRYIDGAAKDQLVALMAETKADTTAFLRFLAVDSLDEIEVRNFAAALNALLAKKAALAKGSSA